MTDPKEQQCVQTLLDEGYTLLPGKRYFQMPEHTNHTNMSDAADRAMGYLFMYCGYGYGVHGFIPPDL